MIYLIVLLLFLHACNLFAWPAKKSALAKENTQNKRPQLISLIVPFRNESSDLPSLLDAISKFDFPKDQLEIIFINDHSLDSGPQMLRKFINRCPFTMQLLSLKDSEGKKAALIAGVNAAKGELILTTDADCVVGPNWVASMLDKYVNSGAVMISAPVLVEGSNNFLIAFQKIEQAILMGLTESYTNANRAVLASAANMAFVKEFFKDEFLNANKSQSGDDVFLLHSLKKKYPMKIAFCNNQEAIVTTPAKRNFSGFLSQRLRWASKSKYYSDTDSVFLGGMIFLINAILLIFFIYFLLGKISVVAFLFLFVGKLILELVLLYRSRNYLRLQYIGLYLPFYSLVYPAYSIGIALLSLLYKPRWKGRNI